VRALREMSVNEPKITLRLSELIQDVFALAKDKKPLPTGVLSAIASLPLVVARSSEKVTGL